jgi:hypothetical protein
MTVRQGDAKGKVAMTSRTRNHQREVAAHRRKVAKTVEGLNGGADPQLRECKWPNF